MSFPTSMDEIANMSDEEILAINMSTAPEPEEPVTEDDVPAEPDTDPVVQEDEDQSEVNEDNQEEQSSEEDPNNEPDTDQPDVPGSEEGNSVKEDTGKEPKEAPSLSDEDFRKFIMAPLRHNKRDIHIKSVEEARDLMSKGLGFGKRMQELAPHMKSIKMLTDNGINDPNELAYLIDLHNKNPEAIKKLLKDSEFDTLEFNPEDQQDYRPQTRVVSDQETQFQTVINDIRDNVDGGVELLQSINSSWDSASVDQLAASPQTLYQLSQNRQSGAYDIIMGEYERLKALGQIPANTPVLQAYVSIGNRIRDNEGFESYLTEEQITAIRQRQGTYTPSVAPQPIPVARRVATPKPNVANSDKARAAASSAKPTNTQTNNVTIESIANMSDADFIKRFG